MAMRSESDFAPSRPPSRPPGETNRSRQLDFYQAMSDFKHMFPEMDEEVIEAVLRANSGAVDATIDQLLTMNIDNDDELELDLHNFKQNRVKKTALEQPPPYSEAIKSNPPPRPARSRPFTESPSHTAQLSPSSEKPNLLDLDVGSFASTLAARGASEPKTVKTVTYNTDKNLSPRTFKTQQPYKHYNPPLLGALPDDFLRLSPQIPERLPRTSQASSSNISQNPTSPALHHSSPGASRISHPVTRSSSLTQPSGSPRAAQTGRHLHHQHSSYSGRTHSQVARHHSTHTSRTDRHRMAPNDRSRSLTHAPTPLSPHQATKSPSRAATHEMSSSMLQRKLKENAWRRKSAPTGDDDPEMTQFLDDERMAIILQNREFLQELRDDKDFMETLNQDVTQEEITEKAETVNTSPLEESQQEGYGADKQDSLDAFPFTAPSGHVDKDAELRRKLSNMGKAEICGKTDNIVMKNVIHSLRDSTAPSMMNLLDEEDYSNGDTPDLAYNTEPYTPANSGDMERRYTSQQMYRPRISAADTSDSSVI